MKEQSCTDAKMSGQAPICGIRCISWTAIFLSALIGFGLSFLLNMLTVSIGLAAFTSSPEGNTTLAIGGFIGLVLAAFISMFIAGWLSGYLGKPYCPRRNFGELYGFSTWCVTLLLSLAFFSNIDQMLTHYNYMVDRNTTTISYTNNHEAPMLVAHTKAHADNTTTSNITVNAEKATNAVGEVTFSIFFLFFIGAIASMFGGRCAMSCRKSEMTKESCSTH